MIELNRILIQLNKAVECANSNFPQEKSIAVTLFDNLIEIQLFKRAEKVFMWDRTTWYNGNRFYNSKIRNNTLGYFDQLLKFSKKNKTITHQDYEILSYAHRLRNTVYHKGNLDNLKIELAILLYYDFINRTLIDWGSPTGLIGFTNSPGYEKIDFGQGLVKDEDSLEYKQYFKSSVQTILSKLKFKDNLALKVKSIISKQIERIKWSIQFIEDETKTLNFYDVLGRFWYLNDNFFNYYEAGKKPKNIDSILILYAFLRKEKDFLDDISDLKQRQQAGRNLLRKFRSSLKGKYPHWTDLERIEKRIARLKNNNSDIALKNLIEIENKIAYLYMDLDEASSDLDGYLQE
jgi:hypothetical protein